MKADITDVRFEGAVDLQATLTSLYAMGYNLYVRGNEPGEKLLVNHSNYMEPSTRGWKVRQGWTISNENLSDYDYVVEGTLFRTPVKMYIQGR